MKLLCTLAWVMLASTAVVGHAEELNSQAGVLYTSVDEALKGLKTKPRVTVQVTKPDGWVIVSDPNSDSQWSFTPNGHYANPAVVRRAIKTAANGEVAFEMTGLCEATKENCDRLMKEFEQMNTQSRNVIRRQVSP